MADLKITVDQLKNYLGTDLKGVHYREGMSLERSLTNTNIMAFVDNETDAKLLFYRLSDLDKEIEVNGESFVPLYELIREFNFHKDDIDTFGLHTIPFGAIQDLLKWHFWLFGDEYFEQGLVIDKRTISKK